MDATAALGERMKAPAMPAAAGSVRTAGRQRLRGGQGSAAGLAGSAGTSTLFGLKMEWTQRSISLVSSPWGSPQITTCAGRAWMAGGRKQRAVTEPTPLLGPPPCGRSSRGHTSPSLYLFEGVMEDSGGAGHLWQGYWDLLQPL